MTDKIDYAAVQAEIAQRVERDANCKACERKPYTLSAPSTEGDGWIASTNFAGLVKLCEPCKTRRPYTWVADIDPIAFTMFMQAHPDVFLIEELRVLL